MTSNESDIAILKLSRPLDLNNKTIKSACFNNGSKPEEIYSNLYATGWGRYEHDGVLYDTTILRKVRILQNLSNETFDVLNILDKLFY